ncbi:MAG: hypothetical protein JNK05_15800 [Myxococcales bacterium]|nr:hypothetical protein [Myxococcales bacterium]
MSESGREFVLVAEDRASAFATATIVDRVIAERGPEWLRDLWDVSQRHVHRTWRGLRNDPESHELLGIGAFTKKANAKLRRGITTLAPGRKGRAVEVAKFFAALDEAKEAPSLAVFACDLDGDAPDHALAEWSDRTGRLAARSTLYVLALAQPEFEAWFVAGFCSTNADEAAKHAAVCAQLHRDPCEHPHELQSNTDGPRDAKVVLGALCGSRRVDDVRVRDCVEQTPLELLIHRGGRAGITRLVEQLDAVRLSLL